ncbi:MAG: creatininase family protein [Deltaproteobacteria bacterium]|nr:creatininase family protein [Deltaproteobacteria bacterium]
MKLTDMTMEGFLKALSKTKTLVVPYGTVEAHGTHLPLSTDTLIMEEIVKKVAEEIPVIVAPPVHYGVCTSTGEHPGSIGISCDTLRAITVDLVQDAYDRGLRNFILISGHGGGAHVAAMKEAGEELTKELPDVVITALTVYELIPKEAYELVETKNDSHAGEVETSLVLFLAEELVNGRAPEEYPNMPRPIIVKDKQKFWPGAVWGNPEKATKEKGEKVFNMLVAEVVKLVKKVEEFKQ